jgi:tRNA(adenine34) deaminase
MTDFNDYWMHYAIKFAKHAGDVEEVPVGAVLIFDNEVIGEGWNQPISSQDPTAHAEIIALRQAAKKIGNYRLLDTILYVTIEPCVMCVGAMIHARIKKLIYGADDPKTGAVKSVFQLLDSNEFNHKIEWQGGLLAEECSTLLQKFFKNKR